MKRILATVGLTLCASLGMIGSASAAQWRDTYLDYKTMVGCQIMADRAQAQDGRPRECRVNPQPSGTVYTMYILS